MAALTSSQLHHYLQRLDLAPKANGASPPPPPTLETLCAVQWAHIKSIPFENLSLRLKAASAHTPSANLDAAFQKLVATRRGGWCFEQNAVFSAALRALGFTVYDGAARVAKLDPPPGQAPPPPGVVPLTTICAHRVCFVEIGDDLYLADSGFGGECPPIPLKLPPQPHTYAAAGPAGGTGLEDEPWAADLPLVRAQRYRVQPGTQGAFPDDDSCNGGGKGSGAFHMRRGFYLTTISQRQGTWKPLYFFQMHEALPQDYDVLNYAHTVMQISPFLSNTIAARSTADGGRMTLMNDTFKVFDAEGELVEERKVPTIDDDEAALVALLESEFGFGGLQ